ncbi:class I SAM-dependent methyltransferase [Acidihalobacter prosperus]|uniref:Methyltransferase domain-containing protein n=1 Tax=Acidihalobacter prosperus TaxID=160660 RepID=A0A1A6C3X4_9GAMM|nr:class I SAM-dependent methyltransferase [Acidihalobacter prosperus]OBS09267.1 hypothetical protein Thpro_021595 [Acidihalobacter prosperus]
MDRKAHWERIYREKSPLEVSWYQADPTLSLSLIEAAGCPRSAEIIDVGGGASRLVDRLLDAGYRHPAVLDLAGAALEHARQRLGDRAEAVEWFEADATTFAPPHRFDVWHDRAVFHFLTEADDRRRYRQTLLRTLRPGGHLILAAFAVGGPDRCSGLEIVQYDAPQILEQFGDAFDLIETREESHRTPGGMIQRFGYFRLIRRSAAT